MAATVQIRPSLSLQVPAPVGTANFVELKASADASFAAVTDTIAQLEIRPDNNITGDAQKIEFRLCTAATAVTASAATDKITHAAHGYANGQPLQVGGTTPPAPLTAGTTYYVVSVATNDYKLALTVGGAALDLTTAGTAVTVRPFSTAPVLSYSYPTSGPGVPVTVRAPGGLLDFTKIKALQIVLRPLDPAANASGHVQLTMGDDTDRFQHFNLPLELAFSAAGAENWPSWTAALPAGLAYDSNYHFTVRIKQGEANANLLILVNLLGN